MRKLISLTSACAALALAGTVYSGTAQAQWGTLKGQVLLDGEVPKIELLIPKGKADVRDAAVCAAQDVPDEKLVVDPQSKGIANVIIYLAKKPDKIHPDLVESKEKEVTF